MRPSWPAPMMPILMWGSSGCAGRAGRAPCRSGGAERIERRGDVGCRWPRIAAASSAAFVAPAAPIASVPTGMPAGICTIDSSESRPFSVFDCTGTPSTGSEVLAAVMPGRWAAPPAPAMITSRPRVARRGGVFEQQVGGAVGRDDPHLVRHAERSSISAACEGLPVGRRTHDDANEWFHRSIVQGAAEGAKSRAFERVAQPAEQLAAAAGGRAAPLGAGLARPATAVLQVAAGSIAPPAPPAPPSRSSRSRQSSITVRGARARSSRCARSSAMRIGSTSTSRMSLPTYSPAEARAVGGDAAAATTASRRFSGRSSASSSASGSSTSATPIVAQVLVRRLSALLLGPSSRLVVAVVVGSPIHREMLSARHVRLGRMLARADRSAATIALPDTTPRIPPQ